MKESTKEELKRLDVLLADMYRKMQLNDKKYIERMHFACVLAAYIKRRVNLVMLAEKQESIDINELSLSIKESLSFLSLTGAECIYDCAFQGKINGKQAGIFYDFFESCIANYYGLPSAVIVRFSKCGDYLVLRIESDTGTNEIIERIKKKFSKYDITIEMDEEVYYSLSLLQGDAL